MRWEQQEQEGDQKLILSQNSREKRFESGPWLRVSSASKRTGNDGKHWGRSPISGVWQGVIDVSAETAHGKF